MLGLTVPDKLLATADEVIGMSAPGASWCDPTGAIPAQVKGSARLVASVAWPLNLCTFILHSDQRVEPKHSTQCE
jgi:hypothetical protein